MNQKDKYGPRLLSGKTWLPEAPLDEHSEPSSMFQKVRKKHEYPAIFSNKSWTKGRLLKDSQMYLKPSETIGSVFTPGAQDLRIQDLPRMKKKIVVSPFGADGTLRYPPVKQRKKSNEQEKEVSKPSPFVSIIDLLSGDYERRKKEEKDIKRKQARMKRKMEALKLEGFSIEKEKGKCWNNYKNIEAYHSVQLGPMNPFVKSNKQVVSAEQIINNKN